MVEPYLIEAADVVPVFERVEPKTKAAPKFLHGCFNCRTHDAMSMSGDRRYTTFLLQRQNDIGDFIPVIGAVLSLEDSRYKEWRATHPNHWLRTFLSNFDRRHNQWVTAGALEEGLNVQVRMYDMFNGEGLQHVLRRVDFSEIIAAALGQEQGDFMLSGYKMEWPGIYIQPHENLMNANLWDIDRVIENVRFSTAYTQKDMRRVVGLLFGNAQIKDNNLVKVKGVGSKKEPVNRRADNLNLNNERLTYTEMAQAALNEQQREIFDRILYGNRGRT